MNKYKLGPWMIAIAALMWATDAPFRTLLTKDLSSTTIVFMEHLFIVLMIIPIFIPRIKELAKLELRDWLAVLFVGVGGSALATVAFTQSFHYVSPSVAVLLQKLQPLIAILLSVLVLNEKMHKRFWFWALIALVGGYLVAFPNLKPGDIAFYSATQGVILALLAALLWGGSTVFGKLVVDKVSFQTMTSLRFLTAFVFLLIMELLGNHQQEIVRATPRDWLFILITSIVSGYVSLLLYYRGLRWTRASVATIEELGYPVAAVVINWIFLGSNLVAGQIVGGIILLLAMTRLTAVNVEEEAIPPAAPQA